VKDVPKGGDRKANGEKEKEEEEEKKRSVEINGRKVDVHKRKGGR